MADFTKIFRKGFFNDPKADRELLADTTYADEAVLNSQGFLKAYIPQFLYKPPYGYPRMVDVVSLRKLAVSPYVFMCISTITDEVCSIDYDILPKKSTEPKEAETSEEAEREVMEEELEINRKQKEIETLAHIKEVKDFFYNPNGNEESFEYLLRQIVPDILTIGNGVFVKVFNKTGKMVQLFSRDSGTFLKNPDIYGYIGNRAEIVFPPTDLAGDKILPYYDMVLRHKAAYFQYGWTAGAMPVPFGKREIVWVSRFPRTDSIYDRSAVEVLQDIIYSLIYGAIFNLDYYTNNNMPDGVIQLIGANQDQIKKFRARFEKQFKVKDTYGNWRKVFHKYPIVNMETKFVPFSLKPAELEIISQQEWFSKLVWACFGITPSELGYTENSNRATELSQSRVFKRKAVKPILKMLEYAINTQIIPEFGYDDIEFKFVEYDINEDLEKHQLYEIQLRNGLRNVNEIREEMGLLPVEGGEKFNISGSNPFGNFNDYSSTGEEQMSKDEMNDVREKLGMEENVYKKSLTSKSPVVPKKKDMLDKELLNYLKQKEIDLLKKIQAIYSSDTLGKIKSNEYKDLWTELIKGLKGFFKPAIFSALVDDFVKTNFVKGLEASEKEFAMNFFPSQPKLKFLSSYNFNLIKDMTDETANDLRTALERAYMNNLPFSQVKDEVKRIFDNSETRAQTIVRTEQTRIDNLGKLDGASQTGLKLMKTVRVIQDDRTTALCKRMYAKYKDKPIGFDERFTDEETGESWEAPPFHVNCRSRIKLVQEADVISEE